ncbi:melanoma-associated antigen 10-like [Oryctolagus cuniculus]|uniref:melanoma-associated antigen 10 n=1 Tax=Oryctolagus cuniculus TaxID=9986 RepID=UPI0001CE1D23|nr:melanoma-associated antigen 10 [Oryctolagus cuniculus]
MHEDQRSQLYRPEGQPQAQGEAPGSEFHDGTGACQDPTAHESSHLGTLEVKMGELLQLLLHKYRMKEPITKVEMLSCVGKNYEDQFPAIFSKVCGCMQLALGIDVKEVDPVGHSYELNTALGLTYDGMLDDDQSMPKTSLLIMILGLIFSEGNCAFEKELWESLSVMGVYADREHHIYGEPRKLLTEEWVREGYLEYLQVSHSDLACCVFLWGPRAHAETTKMRVLEYLAKFSNTDARSFASLYEEALRDEQARVQAGDAVGAGGGARA